jgi:glutathione S-transferase
MFIVDSSQQKAHLARNPFGRVPVLETSDGLFLYESRAIAKYLAANYGLSHLFPSPTDLWATAQFDQAQSVEMSYFSDPLSHLSYEKGVKTWLGQPSDEKTVLSLRSRLERHFDVCEKVFGDSGPSYMAGDKFSLVDIYYISGVARLFALGDGDIIESRPNVQAWWKRCMARPATSKYIQALPTMEDMRKKLMESMPDLENMRKIVADAS